MKFSSTAVVAALAMSGASAFSTRSVVRPAGAAVRRAPFFSSTMEETETTAVANGATAPPAVQVTEAVVEEAPVVVEEKKEVVAFVPEPVIINKDRIEP